MVASVVFGGSGGLATGLIRSLCARGGNVDVVTRDVKADDVAALFEEQISAEQVRILTVNERYCEFEPRKFYDAAYFTQALFSPCALTAADDAQIDLEIQIGLGDPIGLTRKLLLAHPSDSDVKRDFCFAGSTSAYAGFKNTSAYCAVKHGLLGFVRAMNDEYAGTGTRFWLCSMGTMDTAMGAMLTNQDSSTFLDPNLVAERIVAAVSSPSNLFEPEMLIRRRTVRFIEER